MEKAVVENVEAQKLKDGDIRMTLDGAANDDDDGDVIDRDTDDDVSLTLEDVSSCELFEV